MQKNTVNGPKLVESEVGAKLKGNMRVGFIRIAYGVEYHKDVTIPLDITKTSYDTSYVTITPGALDKLVKELGKILLNTGATIERAADKDGNEEVAVMVKGEHYNTVVFMRDGSNYTAMSNMTVGPTPEISYYRSPLTLLISTCESYIRETELLFITTEPVITII